VKHSYETLGRTIQHVELDGIWRYWRETTDPLRGSSLNILNILVYHHGDIIGLVILTCHHMEEGKVPSSMVGSQDVLLPTLIGILVNQVIPLEMMVYQVVKIMQE
jgi:hypothetical protein